MLPVEHAQVELGYLKIGVSFVKLIFYFGHLIWHLAFVNKALFVELLQTTIMMDETNFCAKKVSDRIRMVTFWFRVSPFTTRPRLLSYLKIGDVNLSIYFFTGRLKISTQIGILFCIHNYGNTTITKKTF